jgi:ribosomal protein S18 acetylase RimI-like enzyme
MSSKVVIKDLFADKLEKINIKCAKCNFWFDHNGGRFLDEITNIKSISDVRHIFSRKRYNLGYDNIHKKKLAVFTNNGGIVKGAFKNRKCIGLLLAGSCDLFPKLRSFKVFPPGTDSTFLGCIYVEPDGRGSGIEKKLLIELEKDLLENNAIAIEAIGKRLDDDIDEEEFENSPLLSFKFLINNGFYLKKNDDHYPLLRLDLKSIARRFAREKLSLENLAYKKTVRDPVVIRENK